MSNTVIIEANSLVKKSLKKFTSKNGEVDIHNFIEHVCSFYPNASKEEMKQIIDLCISFAY